jgi:CRP/FNR family transcriptional regulator, cyclic AMP receptor protein
MISAMVHADVVNDWAELIGYAAALSVLATFCMTTMVPLRIVALASNVLFCVYGASEHIYPVLALHAALFPLNLVRLVQVLRARRDLAALTSADGALAQLLPHMTLRIVPAGTTLFRKGDIADRLYYVASGALRIADVGKTVQAGTVIGEIGIFAPDQRRTASVVTMSECRLYELSDRLARRLFFQSSTFGYAVLQMIIARLLENSAATSVAREPPAAQRASGSRAALSRPGCTVPGARDSPRLRAAGHKSIEPRPRFRHCSWQTIVRGQKLQKRHRTSDIDLGRRSCAGDRRRAPHVRTRVARARRRSIRGVTWNPGSSLASSCRSWAPPPRS